jgi:mRNA degradation ribonuclease J1/J2
MRDVPTVKEHIRERLSKSVYGRTKRRPVIIPVVMEA